MEEKKASAEHFKPAVLQLCQNPMTFHGFAPEWQFAPCFGEVVFSTGMTGYDLSLTDPSYAGQILVFTSPIIGNYGVPPSDCWESTKIYAKGVVINNLCTAWSHKKSSQSFLEWLRSQKVALITEVDTRELTKTLRSSGAMMGAISFDPLDSFPSDPPEQKAAPVKKPIISGSGGKTVILVDCGAKENILRSLEYFPLTIKRVPQEYDYSNEEFDGILLSNGPGNPEHYLSTISILQQAMKREKPIFGICLGAQLLALAAGAKTYKLPYGHRGHNQPCIDLMRKRCYITSQNHGYAVCEDSLPENWRVSFRNLNDGSVEGVSHVSLPYFAVQFHPEAAPGPTDTAWLFNQFVSLL